MEGTAILAFNSFFFCSGVGILYLYQNSLRLPSLDTLILKRVLILSGSLLDLGKEEKMDGFQKGPFLIQDCP
jgi:hypothetical protein